MTMYVQTNEAGYVTAIVAEPLVAGLFGGRETMTLTDEQAAAVDTLLKAHHAVGEGLHIRALDKLKDSKQED